MSERQRAQAEDAKMLERICPTEPAIEHPDEPALHKKIKVIIDKKKWNGLVDYEASLAEASSFAVVSDSFRHTQGQATISESETELKDVLTALTDGYHYNWDKHGGAIELWSRDWFKKRTAQIPEEWIEGWRASFKKLGYLCINDCAQIAALTTVQIEGEFLH